MFGRTAALQRGEPIVFAVRPPTLYPAGPDQTSTRPPEGSQFRNGPYINGIELPGAILNEESSNLDY